MSTPANTPLGMTEKPGVVYTKPWVVEAILDLAGYALPNNLVDAKAVEPAAGDGAFVLSMVTRLILSCRAQNRSPLDCLSSLVAYEVDSTSAATMQRLVLDLLLQLDVSQSEAVQLVASWIHVGDYLLEAKTSKQADYIIGNPPYIRLEELDSALTKKYRLLYPTMVGRADIYVAFFEAALRQLKPDGVCAFICADRWMLNQYGAELRNLVTTGFSVETIIEMHQANAFENDVSAYPAITIIRRSKQTSLVIARVGEDFEGKNRTGLIDALDQVRLLGSLNTSVTGLSAGKIDSWFRGSEPWPQVSPAQLAVLRYLENEFYPLESEGTGTKVSIGVATGADDIFITRDPDLVEQSRLLPLAMAADTITGQLQWSGRYLVNPWNEQGLVSLEKYPRLQAYLELHKERISKRHVSQKNIASWYRTIDRVNASLLRTPKLYVPDIKDYLNPVLDAGETYPHHNLYVVYSSQWDAEVLGGLLLSDIAQFFVECYGVRMRGGYLRFQAQYLRRIRVPRPHDISEEDATKLAEAFRQRDRVAATKVALGVYKLDKLPLKDQYD